MYQEKILVTSNDVDDHYELKISTIFKYLQQVSTNHAELIGVGKKDTVDKGMFWVITRIKVVIHKMPKMLDELIVTTHPGETLAFIFPRFYQIYNLKGELMISASSSWALLDNVTRKIKMKPFDNDFKLPYEKDDKDISLPEKVNVEDVTFIDKRKVRYSDIDLNCHLNNTKYIDYLIDIHDIDFYKKHRIKEILINYDKEIRYNDEVEFYSNNKEEEIVVGKINDVHAFSSLIKYEDRNI